jgi:pimeloyl-ACP methyl ester carboxylesterase
MAANTIQSRFFDLGEVRLHYRIAGNGPAVVLLHGWPQTSYAWRHVMADLVRDHMVIAPDLRGLGQSSCPVAGYDKRTIAGDIQALLLKLQITPAAVIGHDWGALVAYSLAHDQPEMVPKLAMLELGVFDDRFYDLPLRFVGANIWHMPFHQVRGLPELLVAGREREYLTWFYRTSHNQSAFTAADIDEYARHYAVPESLHAGFEYYRAIDQDIADQRARAGRKLMMPVLALGGEFSNGEGVGRSLDGIAENLTTGVIANAGHWLPEEQPAAVIERLRAFI